MGAGYGMTETAGSISQASGDALTSRPDASGIILPMMEVRITGEEGEALPVGKTGEIWAKGATLMTEYYGNPHATKAAFEGEWFKTGDVGYLDADGYIYIVDRKTDMVISGGENIYCVEVEAALTKHPDILQVCTFGVPDDRLGERLIACFVAKSSALTSELLENFAKENLASYRVPKEFVRIDDPIELNAMSKIEKHKIRERFLAGEFGG
jgi:long-chain acyl-CoA synthetase